MVFGVEIYYRHTNPMFHFAFPQIVQVAFPMPVLFQVFGHVLGHQDVTGITTIHYPLRDVNSGARYVGATTHVNHTTDRPAVNSHAQLQLRVFACSAAYLKRAFHRRFGRVVENQRHAVTCRNGD